MSLTRKMLAAMDIPAEKIDEIITAHTETVNAIKEERDALKADAAKLPEVEKQLEAKKAELNAIKSGDWEEKYNKLKSEYDGYKTDVETKAVTAKKTDAYRKLLKEAGVSEKRFESILKVTSLNDIKLDKDGNIEGADKLTEGIKSEWADFIVKEQPKGAATPKPPANNGGEISKPSEAALRMQNYMAEHYGKAKED